MRKRKKSTLIIGAVIFAAMIIYFSGTVYFTDHFLGGTIINGVECSMKHYSKAEVEFENLLEQYELIIKEKDCPDEIISAEDVDMNLVKDYEFKKLTSIQNRLKWPVLCMKKNVINVAGLVNINANRADEYINSLYCMDNTDKSPSENAVPEYNGEKFVPKKEVYGNVANKEKVIEVIKNALLNLEREIDLEANDCYIKPERTENDSMLKETCAIMNNYCKAVITYDMLSHTEVVDKDIISNWVICDDELNVIFDEKMVEEYMKEFGEKYNTRGKERKFTTPGGKQATVSGGTYGWIVDVKEETEELKKLIADGANVKKEPVYKQRAEMHGEYDWGENYCDIDLSSQYMWCVKSGEVAYECPIVSGRPNGHTTPSGVYTVLNKAKNATLIGRPDPETGEPIYRTPVSFWMPVTYSGVGMHDAVWQQRFGGDWYKYHGSHGCINMSYTSAAAVYDLVFTGMPVIIHY